MNLGGMLNLGELGGMQKCWQTYNIHLTSKEQIATNMPVAEFVEWYFGTLCEKPLTNWFKMRVAQRIITSCESRCQSFAI